MKASVHGAGACPKNYLPFCPPCFLNCDARDAADAPSRLSFSWLPRPLQLKLARSVGAQFLLAMLTGALARSGRARGAERAYANRAHVTRGKIDSD